ncbi:lipoprotein [alpha proteobacterium U9-1i]|nr:lipoprotein [alpha proteobacterium U9-1i]
MLTLGVSLALLAACATADMSPANPGPSLDGEWREATRALHPPTITFEGERASGFAGCNRWFATVTRGEYPALTFSAVGSTRMMCEGAQMTIEREFLAALGDTQMAAVEGDQLVLSDIAGAEVARFQRVR